METKIIDITDMTNEELDNLLNVAQKKIVETIDITDMTNEDLDELLGV